MNAPVMIRTIHGPVSIRCAARVGPFAVTRWVNRVDLAGWCLTHVPSGTALPAVFDTSAAAEVAGRRLSMIDGVTGLTRETSKAWANANRAAVDRALSGQVRDAALAPATGIVRCACMEEPL